MGHNLEVPEGEFIVGRSSSCQLSLDDALVSRKHALLTVSAGTASIEDLGSRNGVLVNKKKIGGPTSLSDGDLITIGSQEMTIHGLKDRAVATASRRPLFDTMTAATPESFDEPTRTNIDYLASDPDKRVHELSLIGAVAEKALQLGRPDDAVRLLDRPMKDLLARAKRLAAGESVPPIDELAVKRAVTLALRIASMSNAGEWVDYVFELHAARRQLLPAATIDELYSIVRRVHVDPAKLRAYLEALGETAGGLNANEKFLLSRIEGLVEVALLK
jgi:predicted component of type VI protein secretion system